MKSFAERLRFARNLRGQTQAQLARACRVSQGAIANYESGARQAAKIIFRLAAVLRVSAIWLAEGTGPIEFDAPALTAGAYRLQDGGAACATPAWPFNDISPEIYWALSERDRQLIENTVAGLVASLLQDPASS